MFQRSPLFSLAAGLAAASFACPVELLPSPLSPADYGCPSRRSRSPKIKRKLKPNRLHISKRVRRKHRRAS